MLFLISGILAHKWIKSIYLDKTNFIGFYKKRLYRILPLVIITTTVEYILRMVYYWSSGSFYKNIKPSPVNYVLSCLGIQDGWFFKNPNKNALWYISVLLWCYIVFYMVVVLTKKIIKKEWGVYLLCILVIGVGVIIVTFHIDLPFLNDDMSRGYLAFFNGICLAGLFKRIDVKEVKYQLIAILVCVIYCFSLFFNKRIPFEGYIIVFLVWPSIITVCKSKYMHKIYNEKILKKIADCSYDAYLWHSIIISVLSVIYEQLEIQLLKSVVGMLLSLFLTIIISWLSHKFISNPISKKLKKQNG